MKSPWLQDLAWPDVAAYLETSRAVIIPVGSIEQHGEHLPLGTDTMIAAALAESVARAGGALAAPPMALGWSPHHMVLPGTITIRPEILIELLWDVIESLHHHGFRDFLLLNGHRLVNVAWMQIAAERARRKLGARVELADPAWLSREFCRREGLEPIGHADQIETSHMLHVRPDLARMDKARDYVPRRPAHARFDPREQGDTLCYVPATAAAMEESVRAAGGVTGTPSRSDAAIGEAYHRWIVDRLAAIIESWGLNRTEPQRDAER